MNQLLGDENIARARTAGLLDAGTEEAVDEVVCRRLVECNAILAAAVGSGRVTS